MEEKWASKILDAFKKPLPGSAAQQKMSPSRRRPVNIDRPLRNSSVLIMLYPCLESICTVFIKRVEYEGIHSGQISLPGGMVEEKDPSFSDTALRETMEETGVPIGDLQIVGALTPLHIPVSNFKVYPFIATCRKRPDFRPDPGEVQYIIETGIDELLAPDNRKTKVMNIDGNEVEIPYYDIRGNHVWGATAMILSEFLEVYRELV
jgi:8-oxo-dGTP pyrophosphatase MutT (NUDIX family)